MGKLNNQLQKQLTTHYKKDAEDCLKIYDKLKELSQGHVWSSDWLTLVATKYDFSEKHYRPTEIGKIFLKGLNSLTN